MLEPTVGCHAVSDAARSSETFASIITYFGTDPQFVTHLRSYILLHTRAVASSGGMHDAYRRIVPVVLAPLISRHSEFTSFTSEAAARFRSTTLCEMIRLILCRNLHLFFLRAVDNRQGRSALEKTTIKMVNGSSDDIVAEIDHLYIELRHKAQMQPTRDLHCGYKAFLKTPGGRMLAQDDPGLQSKFIDPEQMTTLLLAAGIEPDPLTLMHETDTKTKPQIEHVWPMNDCGSWDALADPIPDEGPETLLRCHIGNLTILEAAINRRCGRKAPTSKAKLYAPVQSSNGSAFPANITIAERLYRGAWGKTYIRERGAALVAEVELWHDEPP
ncbi:uncharacterized protein AMSG_10084 [Thecamonas trahens ATCC 50062]|uniref:GmrSD restriction endonucleases C-terminal domain-containing protein n=1 Tax=Thecamonas trahens ATCC 50062 TaxID=461836 RepID=A0A0L0DSD3_THETB|nr:hypothetical protein AMSG_10084 [Thecamonas trahens ATCC 50062]KNC54368.1 hypothetical protein AMSG_10084 [Thecamonas trahens ATCC 50062]|eukprot:XP_013753671.1 hypothetical protein AMSG_10084 [Thecamonas trahens ATCC 50062]